MILKLRRTIKPTHFNALAMTCTSKLCNGMCNSIPIPFNKMIQKAHYNLPNPLCTLCGQYDDLYHCFLHCPVFAGLRQRIAWIDWIEFDFMRLLCSPYFLHLNSVHFIKIIFLYLEYVVGSQQCHLSKFYY